MGLVRRCLASVDRRGTGAFELVSDALMLEIVASRNFTLRSCFCSCGNVVNGY